MQKHVFLLAISLFFIGDLAAQIVRPIIPSPAILRAKPGIFTLDISVKIAADSAGFEFAKKIHDEILNQTGMDLRLQNIETEYVTGKKILIKYNPALEESGNEMLADGYFLKINPDSIVLDAPLQRGLFYGLQTLRQLVGFDRHREAIPIHACDIADVPGFDYRGVMFDVGRHFLPIDFLKKQADLLAFYKINVLRLHLTEDQGWRIEIKKYPQLTRVSAFRNEENGTVYGGFYTQNELRDFVKYCAERHITVIPEIEMPGHCRAALAAFPQFSCLGEAQPVPNSWGVFSDVFCAGNDSTFVFLENILDEVLQIFPSKIIHIGGDEVPKNRWANCPKCKQRIENEELKSPEDLQSYFVRRIQNFLESRGRTLAGWDEILEGGADSLAVVQVWRGLEKANEALSSGHRVILSPGSHCYLNRSPGDLTLGSVFRFDPLADTFLLSNQSKIMGIEATLWSENITDLNLENMLFPRLAAIAEVAWSGGGDTNFSRFHDRLKMHYPMFDSLKIGYGGESKPLFSYKTSFLPVENKWLLKVEKSMRDLEFWYIPEFIEMKNYGFTLEKPLLSPSLIFEDSLLIPKPMRVKFAPFRNGKQMHEEIYIEMANNLILGTPPKFSTLPDKKYNEPGIIGLTDCLLGTTDFHDGNWLGWQGNDVEFTFDFGKNLKIEKVSPRFLQAAKSWILLPKNVEFYTSAEGQNWTLSWINELKTNGLDEITFIQTSDWETPPNTSTQWLKIVVKNGGKLPAGHLGEGGDSWIFMDEIIVR